MLTGLRSLLRLGRELDPPSMNSMDDPAYFRALDQFQQNAFRSLQRLYPGPENETFCRLVALKSANAFAAAYEFKKRRSVLVSRPVQLQADPTNICMLHCPACLHSANPAWASRFDWPSATLGSQEFGEFCHRFAPFSTNIALFRDGEPLLHRYFHEFVRAAKSYLLYTATCTSLSMRIDAEALVASGLDFMAIAIDGGSASIYQRYRRGGDFELVLENLDAIVRARRKQASAKPWLVWQFLAFQHNVHEIEIACALARKIGLDQFVVCRPYAVEHDDPEIKVAETAPFGETSFRAPEQWCSERDRSAVLCNAGRIHSIFGESWAERYEAVAHLEESSESPRRSCKWLYYSLTMDAARRITPCCLPPMGNPDPRNLVYSNFQGQNTGEVVNSPEAVRSRRQCRSESGPGEGVESLPYCIRCDQNPPPPIPPDVPAYLLSVDPRQALSPTIRAAIGSSALFMGSAADSQS